MTLKINRWHDQIGYGMRLSWQGRCVTVIRTQYIGSQGYARIAPDDRPGVEYWAKFKELELIGGSE